MDEVRDCTNSMTIAEIIADVMNREVDGIKVTYAGLSDESEEAVFFEALYPWQMSDTEKNLTQNALEEIFRNYGTELGVPEGKCFEEIDMRFSG